MARRDLTDFEWPVIEPLLPTQVRGVARPPMVRKDERSRCMGRSRAA